MKKKICYKCKLQFLAENLRKFLVLNGLCLVWPIVNLKNILLLTLLVSKWLWLTVLKKLLFWPMSITKLIIFFWLPRLPHEKINHGLTDINQCLTDIENQFYKVSITSVKYRLSIGLYRLYQLNIGLLRFLPYPHEKINRCFTDINTDIGCID